MVMMFSVVNDLKKSLAWYSSDA